MVPVVITTTWEKLLCAKIMLTILSILNLILLNQKTFKIRIILRNFTIKNPV